MSKLLSVSREIIKPVTKLKPSEWAEKYFYLSVESSTEYGKYKLNRTPYQKEMIDAPFEEGNRETYLMLSSQIGKTTCELILLGYLIDREPSPILWVAPTIQMAEATSTDRIAPMLRDCPTLRDKVKPARSKDSGNKILHKEYPGGQLDLAGANSEASLASRPKRVLLFDEVDKYPESAGEGGDPIDQAVKRSATFWNRIIYAASTPDLKGKSRIEKGFLSSDQRYFHLPCPHCDYSQPLTWESFQYSGKGTDSFDLSDLAYFCKSCGCAIDEKAKPDMLAQGAWVKHAKSEGVAGFHCWEAYSPWVYWKDICLNYQASYQDAMRFRTWQNLSLGISAEVDDKTIYDWQALLDRAEKSDYSMGQIPSEVLFMTSGVDVQPDRLEVAILGFSEGEQLWLIDYHQIYGDTDQAEVWQDLQKVLDKKYKHPLGGFIKSSFNMIDTGYNTHNCYMEVKKRRNWYAIKGVYGLDKDLVSKPTLKEINYRGQVIKSGIKLYSLGVDNAKNIIMNRCKINIKGHKYFNVPNDLTEFYAKGLLGSEVLIKKYTNGKPKYMFQEVPNVRNEPLDTTVYAYCAGILAGIARSNFKWEGYQKLLTVENEVNNTNENVNEEINKPIEQTHRKPMARRRQSNFLRNFATDY